MNIPDKYPESLEDCLKIFEEIKYESYGFPIFFLDYDYKITKKWSASFRNPVNFDNPGIKSNTPLQACYEMFDFLKTLKNKQNEKLD